MYIAGRLRTASMPPSTLIESAVYSPLPPLMAASFPFFALVSTMEVVISFVAIQLRGEAGLELLRRAFRCTPTHFKLLKLLAFMASELTFNSTTRRRVFRSQNRGGKSVPQT